MRTSRSLAGEAAWEAKSTQPTRLRRWWALLLGVATLSALASEPPIGASIVVDAATGQVLQAASPDRAWYPASLAKLMTLYLVFEAIDAGELPLSRQLPVTKEAARQPATRLGLKAGARIAVEDAIMALTVASANDAAVVLAESLAGTEAKFAVRMSSTARRLGLVDTTFSNASGLPGRSGQRTTARDVARLGIRLLRDFPHHYHYFSAPSLRFGGRMLANHNRLLGSRTLNRRRADIDGLKTGFTCDAGYNIVTSAEREGRRVFAVVLGAASRGQRDRRARALLEAAFAGPPRPSVHEKPLRSGGAALRPARPPVRLGPGECGSAPLRRLVTKTEQIRGWSIFLGNFTDPVAARQHLEATANRLSAANGHGAGGGGIKGALLERPFPNAKSWKLLIVGLSQAEAGQACQALRIADRTCVAHSPARLAMPGYLLR